MPSIASTQYRNYNKPTRTPEPVKVKIAKETKKEAPEIKSVVYPKYDLFKAPINVFDWDNAGVLFKSGLNGHRDLKQKQLFADLCNRYEIQNFYIDNGLVYFLFKLK